MSRRGKAQIGCPDWKADVDEEDDAFLQCCLPAEDATGSAPQVRNTVRLSDGIAFSKVARADQQAFFGISTCLMRKGKPDGRALSITGHAITGHQLSYETRIQFSRRISPTNLMPSRSTMVRRYCVRYDGVAQLESAKPHRRTGTRLPLLKGWFRRATAGQRSVKTDRS